MVTIKKYSNRRLYDTSESSYITLEDLADKIRTGVDVRVVDAKTDRDLTQQVLAQIILESRGAAQLLPVPLLMRLIRMGEDHLAEFFGQFMSWSLEIYLRFKQSYETASPYNLFAGLGFGDNNPLARIFGQRPPWDTSPPWQDYQPPSSPGPRAANEPAGQTQPPEPEPSGLGEASSEASAEDVAAMREELDELKDLIRKMAGDD